MSEEGDCALCFFAFDSTYRRPLLMPCGHSVCQECVEEAQKKGETIECPFDNEELQDVALLKPNEKVA